MNKCQEDSDFIVCSVLGNSLIENFWHFQTNMDYWLQCSLLYGSGGIHRACGQATRFESILAKQETANATVVDGA